MTDRDIFRSFGYDPDDPVPRDDQGQRVIPDRLLKALADAPVVDPTDIPRYVRWAVGDDLPLAELGALLCVSHGMSYKTAARVLGRALETIHSQLKVARYRLRAATTTEACCEAIRRGLIP